MKCPFWCKGGYLGVAESDEKIPPEGVYCLTVGNKCVHVLHLKARLFIYEASPEYRRYVLENHI